MTKIKVDFEFLNTIKSELNDKVESANLKSVIRIIDKNINRYGCYKSSQYFFLSLLVLYS